MLRRPQRGDPAIRILTVGEWLAHWLASRTSPATSTMRGYAAHVRLYLAPCLGPVLLSELSVAHVQAMFTAIIRQHHSGCHAIKRILAHRPVRVMLSPSRCAGLRPQLDRPPHRRPSGPPHDEAADGRLGRS
jgi:hypothetical protein